MTVYHPRVGHDIVFVNASASGSPANDVPIKVGRTTVMVSPPPGYVSGPMGGVSLSGASIGDEVLIGVAGGNYDAINAKVYLPSGESVIVSGVTNFTITSHIRYNGDSVRLTKIDTTHWVFDRV